MKVLIIGCGYLGRRVAAAWVEEGHTVAALTRSDTHAAQLQADNITPIVGDVTQPNTLTSLPTADVMLYAVGLDRSAGLSQRTVYVDGLTNVLDIMRDRIGRMIYISSSSVYGQQSGEWIDETSLTLPTTSRGQVCLEAEEVVRHHFPGEDNSVAVVLRLSGIYGPGRLLRRIEAVRSQTPITGDPQAWLNLIHVDDAVTAVRTAAAAPSPAAKYLVSDDQPVRRIEYYTRLAERLDAEPPQFDSTEPSSSRVSGLGKRCRNTRLRQELGVSLKYPTIETGLPHALAAEI